MNENDLDLNQVPLNMKQPKFIVDWLHEKAQQTPYSSATRELYSILKKEYDNDTNHKSKTTKRNKN